MKLSKPLLQAIVVAVTIGSISSCKKETDAKVKKAVIEKNKEANAPESCPACGMG